jgi:hypothetical protein
MNRIYKGKAMLILSRWYRKGKAILRNEKGIGLAESLVAVAILGTAIVALTVALSAGSLAVNTSGHEVRLQSLAQSQLDYTKSCPYVVGATTYPTVDISLPDGYSISVTASGIPEGDENIQKITATVYVNGEDMMTVEDLKVNR